MLWSAAIWIGEISSIQNDNTILIVAAYTGRLGSREAPLKWEGAAQFSVERHWQSYDGAIHL